MTNTKKGLTYSVSGVSYEIMDPVKRLAQEQALQTSNNLEDSNMRVVEESRGESAFVWEEEDSYRAFVIEGLGTKNLVADEMYKITGKSYYSAIAQDTVAAIVNDVIVVGAKPQVLNAYFGLGSSEFLNNKQRTKDLVEGWAKACNLAGVVWGGGETPTNKGIINSETIDLAGSCVGIIKPKERLTLGEKLAAGDRILLIESSGIHANGLTLARIIASELPQGYNTQLPNGQTFGEALLTPTYIYAKLIEELFEAGVDIHYMVNITGHGFRKLMRARKGFTYLISQIPPTPSIFEFIQKHSENSDEEMYGNFNMGAGFAIFLEEKDIEKAQEIASKKNYKSYDAGQIEEGEKQVIIKPKNITFKGETLGVR